MADSGYLGAMNEEQPFDEEFEHEEVEAAAAERGRIGGEGGTFVADLPPASGGSGRL